MFTSFFSTRKPVDNVQTERSFFQRNTQRGSASQGELHQPLLPELTKGSQDQLLLKSGRDETATEKMAGNRQQTNLNQMLSLAVEDENIDSAAFLLENGADPNAINKKGTPLLVLSAVKGNINLVKLLLGHPDVEVNRPTKTGWMPLHIAAFYGQAEVVKQLLAHPGVNVNQPMKGGATPLYIAALNGQAEIVKLLLAQPGVNVNHPKPDRDTPLSIAAREGHTEVAKLLVAHPGIDVNQPGPYGASPRWIARKYGHFEIVDLIMQNGGKGDMFDMLSKWFSQRIVTVKNAMSERQDSLSKAEGYDRLPDA